MRTLCRRARLHYCDLLGQPIEAVARVSGHGGADDARARGRRSTRAYFKRMEAIEFAVQVRRRRRPRPRTRPTSCSSASRARRRRRSRSISATSARRRRTSRSSRGSSRRRALRDRPAQDRRPRRSTPSRLAEIRARARAHDGRARTGRYAELTRSTRSSSRRPELHRRLGCPVIDISDLSIEETAHRVVRVVDGAARGAW